MLERGSDINACSEDGRTPLQEATDRGKAGAVQLLLSRQANVHSKDNFGQTALHIAAFPQGYPVSRFFPIVYGAEKGDPTAKEISGLGLSRHAPTFSLLERIMTNDYTLQNTKGIKCSRAARASHETIARQLLENSAKFNETDNEGMTALQLGALCGHEAIVRLLLDYHTNVSATGDTTVRDVGNMTALDLAYMLGYREMLQHIKEGERDIESRDSAMLGYEAVTALLTEAMPDTSMTLHPAALFGFEDQVNRLIECGANVNATDAEGRTPLHVASCSGNESIVRLLLDKGADINSRDQMERSPLTMAVDAGHESIARLLVEKGAAQTGKDFLRLAAWPLASKATQASRTTQSYRKTQGIRITEAYRMVGGRIVPTGHKIITTYAATSTFLSSSIGLLRASPPTVAIDKVDNDVTDHVKSIHKRPSQEEKTHSEVADEETIDNAGDASIGDAKGTNAPSTDGETSYEPKITVKELYASNKQVCKCCINWTEHKPFQGEDTEAGDDEDHHIITRRRQPHGGRNTWKTHSIHIHSMKLRQALEAVFDDYPTVDIGALDLTFNAPFIPFCHRWERLLKFEKEEANAVTAKHLRKLQALIEPEIKNSLREMESFAKTGNITFASLGVVFLPGEIIIKASGDNLAAGILREVTLKNSDSEEFYVLTVGTLDWDGQRYGVLNKRWYLMTYAGSRQLMTLGVYPLRVVQNRREVEQNLIERGRKFEALRGKHVRKYVGKITIVSEDPYERPKTNLVSFDTESTPSRRYD